MRANQGPTFLTCRTLINTQELRGRSAKWVALAAQATSELVRRALEHVRGAHAHFNASNGADHFMVFSYDHARCDLAPGLRLAEWGQLFSIQSYGDLTYTCASHPHCL